VLGNVVSDWEHVIYTPPLLFVNISKGGKNLKYLLAMSALFIALGGLVALTPWYIFPVCAVSEGAFMRCGYTARAETGVVAPLIILVGAMLPLSKTKELRGAVGIFGFGLGVLVLLLPIYIIGMCQSPDMPCRIGTLPSLVLLGSATIVASIITLAKR
jgi:hypothetical protein